MARFKRKISAVTTGKPTVFLWVFLFMLTPVLSFAQGGTGPPPCNDGDPFNDTCPLDNWVWLLVAIVITGVTYQSLRKRKDLNSQV